MQRAPRHGVCDVRLKERCSPNSGQEARQMSTALVPIAPASDSEPVLRIGSRPRADFLAQLIATSVEAPQTRMRRRAEPDVAIAAYCLSDQAPATTGGEVHRSL
jgi:hypothetical protein